MFGSGAKNLEELQAAWQQKWETALSAWSRFIKLSEPRWCFTTAEEKEHFLTSSFAMIRLTDHAVVISLRQIKELGLESFAVEILAHEIGHHAHAPADLRDNGRLLARIKSALPMRESYSNLVSNLYTDLLINDRLQRSAGLDMQGVYLALGKKQPAGSPTPIWSLTMRIYELLWRLPSGTLTPPVKERRMDFDAGLGARVIRVYAKDWLAGAGRFAALLLPYLLEIPQEKSAVASLPPWFDTQHAGTGDEIPDGLSEIENDEKEGAIHPVNDPALSGIEEEENAKQESTGGGLNPLGKGAEERGGRKSEKRTVSEYIDLLKSIGVKVPEKEMVMHYYRELASPYLIRFPERIVAESTDPIPEGLDLWEAGEPLSEIDWAETTARSPVVIPGATTLKRLYGSSPGSTPERAPVDIYIGIDCSGSMTNPAYALSYPALAGVVIACSALRAGARVMACLSGEPGSYAQTDGFVRSEKEVLGLLTHYLGTGSSFGIERLDQTFGSGKRPSRPAHVLIITDADIFWMLRSAGGWGILEETLRTVGGGGTFVLEIPPSAHKEEVHRMREIGWDVHTVNNQQELIAFARAFSKLKYEKNSTSGYA
jgi:hypothetical protein